MAGRPREPIDLIKAKGRKHLTKAEYEDRKSTEIDVPYTDIKPPKYLNAKQKKEFRLIASKLLGIDIMTELDIDVLAQYILAKELYLQYTAELEKVLANRDMPHKWDMLDEISSNCADQETLIDLLETILRRQRGDDATVLMNLQDKAFKQCLACAKELGLTIKGRAQLVIPQPPDDDDEL